MAVRIKVLDATFLTTAVAKEGYPSTDKPEVAFVGRSNVGKSSMINALTERRKLVRVSNTPGRTRTLNFFDVRVQQGEERLALRFSDLPGYGYAKVAKKDREQWGPMIDGYLQQRANLRAIVSIVDAEVGPTSADIQTLDYLAEASKPILCVATKMDRLPKSKRLPRRKEISAQLELPLDSVFGFSAVEHLGREALWAALLATLFPRSP